MEEKNVLPPPPPAHKHTESSCSVHFWRHLWNKVWTETRCYMVMIEAAPLTPTGLSGTPNLDEYIQWFWVSNVRTALLKADLTCAPALTIWTAPYIITWTWLHKSSRSTFRIKRKQKKMTRSDNDAKMDEILPKLSRCCIHYSSFTTLWPFDAFFLTELLEFWCHILVIKSFIL